MYSHICLFQFLVVVDFLDFLHCIVIRFAFSLPCHHAAVVVIKEFKLQHFCLQRCQRLSPSTLLFFLLLSVFLPPLLNTLRLISLVLHANNADGGITCSSADSRRSSGSNMQHKVGGSPKNCLLKALQAKCNFIISLISPTRTKALEIQVKCGKHAAELSRWRHRTAGKL